MILYFLLVMMHISLVKSFLSFIYTPIELCLIDQCRPSRMVHLGVGSSYLLAVGQDVIWFISSMCVMIGVILYYEF